MGNTKLANPAPLGLMGFGMTTILLNLHNIGMFPMDGIILAMGIFYGGIAQIFAGLLEYKKGNTFGLTAFTSYGSFWLTLVAILLMPKMGLADAANAHFLGVYLGLWGVFTLFMFFGTLKGNRALQFVFLSLTVLFALLAIGHLVDNESIVHIAGWIGLVCGASAIYLAMGEVLNEHRLVKNTDPSVVSASRARHPCFCRSQMPNTSPITDSASTYQAGAIGDTPINTVTAIGVSPPKMA
jgi:succinate-acetate transporter protein